MADNDTREASTSEAAAHEPAADNGPPVPSAPSAPMAIVAEVPATVAVPVAQAASEAASADSASADAAPDAEEGGDEADGHDGAAAGEPSVAGLLPDGTPRKRKRRRRKKKGGASVVGLTSPGTEGAPVEGAVGATGQPQGEPQPGQASGEAQAARPQPPRRPQQPKKDPAQVPFGRFFEGSPGSRRHAFAVGEVVAGRVTRTAHGTILVDLFGKATAIVDETEPREVQFPPPAAEKPLEVAPGDAAAVDTAPSDAAVVDAAPSDAAAVDAAPSNAAAVDAAPTESTAGVRASLPAQVIVDPAGSEPLAVPAVLADSEEHAEVDHDDGGGEHEDAGTLAAPIEADLPPPPLPSIGEIYRGRVGAVAESGHIALVNRLIDGKAARQRIERAREDRTRVIGLVYGFNRGGFDVLVDGVRAFCPASGMALGHVEDPVEYVGQKLEFSVPPVKAGTHGLVVSRRAILERESRKQARDRVKSMQLGERVHGVVSQVREFGLFIDIGGGLEGMVHVSEMSWDRAAKPSDIAHVGDEVDAQVIRLPDRKDKKERHERIGLSLKAVQADPWDEHGDLVAEGRVFKGKITRVAEFGAFVEVTPGVEGLLHVSELGTNLQHAKDGAKEGEEIWVLIERTDKKARRLSLSKLSAANVKGIESGEINLEAFKVKAPKAGAALQVIVERVEQHGIFVQLEGVLGRKGRGYIPNVEMATERGTDHRRKFPIGTKLEAKIIGTDREGGLKLSRKALINDEEKRAVQDYRREASKQGLGTFGDLLRAKLGGKV